MEAVLVQEGMRAKLLVKCLVDEAASACSPTRTRPRSARRTARSSTAVRRRRPPVRPVRRGAGGAGGKLRSGDGQRRFYFVLARDVFHCSVAELLRRVSARELAEWEIFYQLQAEDDEAAEKESAEPRRNWP
jgi:hypothetical protein